MMLPVESFYRRGEGPNGGTLHGMRIIPIPNLSAGGSLCPWYTQAHFDSDNLSTSSRNTTHKTNDAASAAAKPLKFGMDRILASSPPSSPQPSPQPLSPAPPSTSSDEPERLSDSPHSPVHHNSSAAQSVSALPPSKRYAGEVACPRPTHGAPQLLFPHALLGSYAAGSLFPSCFAPAGTDPSSLPLHPNPAAVMRQGWPYLTPHYHGYPLFSSGGHGRRSPGSDSGPSGKRKRSWSRAVFSALQRKGLEKRFDVQKYVTKPDRRQLAAMLGLTDAQVKVWFQNRRMKWRHQMEAAKKATEERKSTEADDTRAGAKRDTPRAVGNAASQAISDTKTDSVVPHS